MPKGSALPSGATLTGTEHAFGVQGGLTVKYATSLFKDLALEDFSANALTFVGAANYGAMRTALGVAIGTDVQGFSPNLSGLAALASTGVIARTGAGTFAARTLTAPAAG